MKKLISLLALMTVLILAFAACGSDETPTNDEPTTNDYETTTYDNTQYTKADDLDEAETPNNPAEPTDDAITNAEETPINNEPEVDENQTTMASNNAQDTNQAASPELPTPTTPNAPAEPPAAITTSVEETPINNESTANEDQTTEYDNTQDTNQDTPAEPIEPETPPAQPLPAEPPIVVATATTTRLEVEGINCGRCVTAIRNAVMSLEGAISVSVSRAGPVAGIVAVEHYTYLDVATITNTIVAEGFVVN